ncbi:MAG: hypothetical protein GY816_16675, partial [Cytophagales bacterium]|nr:hypothetical protein [Cytophagales bacterium]
MGNHNSDKFYEDDAAGDEHSIQQISDILGNCLSYTSDELNRVIMQLPTVTQDQKQPGPNITALAKNTKFSSYFINIDGNNTNFDTLLTELKRINHAFSVIGIAETNTDEPLKELYQIPGYNAFYQSTIEDKLKGTGVAIYVANHLNVEVIENLGYCTPDFESIFVKISQSSINHSLTCGVIYRPPSGNFQNFIKEFNHI